MSKLEQATAPMAKRAAILRRNSRGNCLDRRCRKSAGIGMLFGFERAWLACLPLRARKHSVTRRFCRTRYGSIRLADQYPTSMERHLTPEDPALSGSAPIYGPYRIGDAVVLLAPRKGPRMTVRAGLKPRRPD